MSYPELLKSSSNSPPPHPKGITTGFVMVVKRKNWKFFLFTTITKPVKGDFSRVKKVRDDS